MTPDDAPITPDPSAAYASFPRRFQALAVDTAIVLLALIATFLLSELARDVPGSGRIAVVAMFAALLLYEPLMVWRAGGTIGHRAMNLRVVDDATGGNPTLLQALGRFAIKGVLGIVSFTTMALTRRHQAVHDRLTGTTVQIRDLTRARPWDYQQEREMAVPAGMPSRVRRAALIGVYLAAGTIAFGVASLAAASPECLEADRCTAGEEVMMQLLTLAWIAISIAAVIGGWRGRLPGARLRRPEPLDVSGE